MESNSGSLSFNELNNSNSFLQPEIKTSGKTQCGKIVNVVERIGCGVLAVISGLAVIMSLPFTLPAYIVLRLVDHYRGIKFKTLYPCDRDDNSFAIYPLLVTGLFVVCTMAALNYATTGDKK